MNPLQKKCIIATAGFHLLLLLVLFIGPGFFRRETPPDTLPVLKVIPTSEVTDALTTGSSQATPVVTPPPPVVPPVEPTPPTPPAPQPAPTPEPPKPVVTPEPAPKPEVKPAPPEPTEPPKSEVNDQPDPIPKPVKKIEVSLKPVVRNVTQKPKRDTTAEDEAAADEKAAQIAARHRALAFRNALNHIRNNETSSTEVDTSPGESSASVANYGQIVKSIYENAWNPPDSADSDEASPKVHIVIASDGTVISAHISEPSGDKALDDSVQRTLDRVTFIRPFPDGAKEKERSYNIKFDLKAKRLLG